MNQKKSTIRKRPNRSNRLNKVVEAMVVEAMVAVPFCLGAIVCAYAEFVPSYTDTLRQIGGGLAIIGVCMFFGANGVLIVWGLLPRFHQTLRQKELPGKLLYVAFLITGISFIFWFVSLLVALWQAAMRV